jgi:GTPase
VFEISAVSREGLRELSFALAELVDADRAARLAAAAIKPRIVLRPKAVDEKDFTIRFDGGTEGLYRVLGPKPERWVQQTDFNNEEAVGFLADRLAKLGIDEALFAAGAEPGAPVVIGEGDGRVFDWEPTLTSAAELIQSPRGTDPRFDDNRRRTTSERREEYHERMDARAALREEFEQERRAALGPEEDDD